MHSLPIFFIIFEDYECFTLYLFPISPLNPHIQHCDVVGCNDARGCQRGETSISVLFLNGYISKLKQGS